MTSNMTQSTHKGAGEKAGFTPELLYSLELGATIRCGWDITRVPGGWIFAHMNVGVFVPFDNEFSPQFNPTKTDMPF